MELIELGLALTVALVFGVTGVVRVVRTLTESRRVSATAGARRAIEAPASGRAWDVARGIGEGAGASAVAVGIRFPEVGLAGGAVLAVFALWSAAAASRPPVRVGSLILSALSFLLAAFYLGFRD